MNSQIAAQLYTLRDFTKTSADIARTLARVKKIGYSAVQLSALGPIDPAELGKILEGEGLSVCATHVPVDRLRGDRQRVIEEHGLWNCKFAALGMFRSESNSSDDWRSFAREFNALASAYASAGVALGYHNHSHELARCDGGPGQTALQLLMEEFSPGVWFEIDTYWIAHGGGDPGAWIRKLTGRVPCVHLKDMSVSPQRERFMTEVGEGNLNWPGILEACSAARVQWYIVEQDLCRRDPFDSLALSLSNLHSMGLS